MNVANRKLFTNRDARAKLSSMGGIMASSPELLGEVQKFAEAGEVKAPMFLVQLPGLIGGNEFLHITAVELQSLKASQPGLMDQRGVVIQQSTPEILSELNPAQLATTDNANVQRMFSDLGVALPETDASVEEGPSNRALAFNRLKEQLSDFSFFPEKTEGTIDTGPGFFSPESNAVRMSALKDLTGIGGGDSAQTPTSGFVPQYPGDVPEGSSLSEYFEDQPSFSEFVNSYRVPQYNRSEEASGILAQLDDPSLSDNARASLESRLKGIESRYNFENLGSNVLLGNIADNIVGPSSRLAAPLVSSFNPSAGETMLNAADSAKARQSVVADPAYEAILSAMKTAENRDAAGITTSTNNPKLDETEQRAAFREGLGREEIVRDNMDPGVGGPEVAIEDIDKAIKAAERDKIIVGAVAPGVGGPGVDIEDIDEAVEAAEKETNIVLDPDKIKKDIADGGRGSGAIIGGITGTNQNLSPKDSVKAYQAMYKEMLGMDDEDEEKEKWHQMAMIGFAIAAGQDPNALSNIAGGLLEGTKMAKKDRMRKKDRDDKFTMMAIQTADADRRAALAAGATVEAANLKYNRDVELIDKRAGIASDAAEALVTSKSDAAEKLAAANLAKQTFLKTKQGEIAASLYKTIMVDDNINPEDRVATFLQRAGAGGPKFLREMGIPTTASVGKGVTGSGSTLVFE